MMTMRARIGLRWLSCPEPLIFHQGPCTNQIRSIRSIVKPPPKPCRFESKQPKALSAIAALKRREHTTPFRTGLLVRKKGMSLMFDSETGNEAACTVLQVDRCQVTGTKTLAKHGYYAVQIGCGYVLPRKLNKAMLGHYSAIRMSPKEDVAEFMVRGEEGLLEVGTSLHPSWFKVGQLVDSRSVTKGKGFAGVMKRHGMSGQPASHGQSLMHRGLGSAGGGQGSGSRVHPGKRMAGNMGGQRNTIQHLKVLKVDDINGLITVKGRSL